MPCCAVCFGDPGLAKSIIPARSTAVGNCPYCLSSDVPLVEPNQLAAEFEVVISIYEPDPAGKQLVEWLRLDWGLFRHPRMDDMRARDLLAAVLDNGDIVRQPFSPATRYHADHIDRWEELREELMYKNRYFPDSQIDLTRLKGLFAYLIADDAPTEWFRARIQPSDVAFTAAEMGAPPARVVSHGRANPPGIPYLYLGSSAVSSVAETRPHTGEVATVATFELPAGLMLIDLRDPRYLVSPFLIGDEDEVGLLRADVAFLERLGIELTRPVVPQGAAIDYVPSQYLCEFIKKSGYDGVIYSSSVSEGMNLALFDPALADCRGVVQTRVERVTVKIA